MAGISVQSNTNLCSGGIYESVDLGLPSGTLWAKCNIGAKTETDYGDLFSWGATTPYIISVDNTANYSNNFASTIQRNLYPNEDAASVQWGKGWSMPTKAQINELKTNTDGGIYTILSGVEGLKFTSDNGNYVFLPSAGLLGGTSVNNRGNTGYYWTCSIYNDVRSNNLVFNSSVIKIDNYERFYGFSIRPVRVK